MGTRGLMGLVIDGELKASYNHFDSYPSGLGVEILKDLNDLLITPERAEITRQEARDLKLVPDEEDNYHRLRGLQGQLLNTLSAGEMVDGRDFALDSLFCEWGYVVDFDNEVLEVYRGFQKQRPTKGRWAGRPTAEEDAEREAEMKELLDAGNITEDYFKYATSKDDRYYAVELVGTFEFGNITDEQLNDLEQRIYSER